MFGKHGAKQTSQGHIPEVQGNPSPGMLVTKSTSGSRPMRRKVEVLVESACLTSISRDFYQVVWYLCFANTGQKVDNEGKASLWSCLMWADLCLLTFVFPERGKDKTDESQSKGLTWKLWPRRAWLTQVFVVNYFLKHLRPHAFSVKSL